MRIEPCSHVAGLSAIDGVVQGAAAGRRPAACGRVARVPGSQISRVTLPIPAYIERVFRENGHVPFTYLTDDSIRRALEGRQDGNEGVQLRGGVLVTSSKELSRAGEEAISYQQWCQAFNRFMLLVELYCPDDHPGWTAHYHYLVGHESFNGDEFDLYLMYDTAIRFASIANKSFDLATVQDTVLAHAQTRFQANTALAEIQRLFASSAQVAGASGPVWSGGGRAVAAAAAAAAPINTALARHRTTTGVDPDKICLRCGRRDAHQTRLCLESSSFDGGAILLQGVLFTQSQREAWSDSKGRQYCYNSNTGKGCTRSGCTYAHSCTLCGSSAHLGLTCSRGQPA
jgi:hypothetical protein